MLSDYLNLLSQVNWWVSLFAAIPLSIIANILTPYVQNWLAKKSTKKAQKRLKELQSELDTVSDFVNNKDSLHLHLTRSFFIVLIFIGLGGTISYIPFVGSVFYLIAILRAVDSIQLTKKVQDFDNFKSIIESQIAEIKSKTTL